MILRMISVSEEERGRMWAAISELQRVHAVLETKVEQNRISINELVSKKADYWDKQFESKLESERRANNVKVAIIGAIAVALPTIYLAISNAWGG